MRNRDGGDRVRDIGGGGGGAGVDGSPGGGVRVGHAGYYACECAVYWKV